jgi:phosphodiesterase/alkaline phosphatase D-like protein
MKLHRIVRLLFVFAIAAAAGAALLFPAIDSTPAYPQRIVLTLTADPAHSQAVTWRLSTPISHPQAQISAADADPAFTKSALTVSAEHTGSDSYAAMFKDLKADTLYSYRVGGDSSWSEWNNFHTASDKPAPFSFLYFGDAQNDISSMWSRVVRAAVLNAPGARFMVHAGDLVAESYD